MSSQSTIVNNSMIEEPDIMVDDTWEEQSTTVNSYFVNEQDIATEILSLEERQFITQALQRNNRLRLWISLFFGLITIVLILLSITTVSKLLDQGCYKKRG